MSAETKKVHDDLADQLSELDESLGARVDDVAMLAELESHIGRLLADGRAVERDIRSLLQERFDRGSLRRETFQLVKSVLDRFATEKLATAPVIEHLSGVNDDVSERTASYRGEPDGDDPFSSTTVIAQQINETPTVDDRVQVGSVLRDRFLLQERVTGGSMGVVYKAMDQRLSEAGSESPFVAIKVLSPQLSTSRTAVRALQQEAAKGRCLLHPNIVRFVDLDRDDDLYFIVMEWLEGRTLADILDSPETRTIDVDRALEIVRQIGRALDYAHRCGIVHADVKPGNIMIQPDGTAKLFDFGVARVRQAQKKPGDLDPQAIGAMTPAYSSVQVLNGEEPTAADDVFSLGCLLYRLIAGYRVFGPRNAAEAAEEGMTPQRLDALSATQWSALNRALASARDDRFASMEDFIDALDGEAPLRATTQLRATIQERLADVPAHGGNRSGIMIAAILIVLAGVTGYLYRDALFETAGVSLDEIPRRESSNPTAQPETPTPAVDAGVDEPVAPASDAFADNPLPAPSPLPEPEAVDIVDFALLPPADYEIELSADSEITPRIVVTLREDAEAVTIDLKRSANLEQPLNLKIEEIGHSGNRSPWVARQFGISDDGSLSIPAQQDRGRITLTMAGDPLREADQQSTLRIRVAEIARSELGLLEVVLEDDDQRAFEAGLPANTIAFAVSQIAVSERDPAVQIDILRFNPDDQSLSVEYVLSGITAAEGEDYFAAGDSRVYFAPGQRSARVLVPLVQDSSLEGDEAFAVELLGEPVQTANGVYRRLVVIIRDDEIASP